MNTPDQVDCDSLQDHYDEYTLLVQASYDRLFEALLGDAVEREASEPVQPA